MPWRKACTVEPKQEFVILASQEWANVRELCRRYEVSPRTGYKWLKRYREEGLGGLLERPRTPRSSPGRTPPGMEGAVIKVREQHPAWGGRKIRAWLLERHFSGVPSPSTITAILGRRGLLDPAQASFHRPVQRFEHPRPNDLWQMDFKGHFPLCQGRCHPLTVLDDHSRFALGLEACGDEREETVKERLTNIFRRYGLPQRMVMDNGAPWGSDRDHPYTPLTVWLMQLGIGVSHGRPYHPQTQGKDERFHRTLKAEVLQGRTFQDLAHCQSAFAGWRDVYNLERPHQALGYAPPASRYQVSSRLFPETLPPIEYGPEDKVRKVQDGGLFFFQGRCFRISKAFRGSSVALRPTIQDGLWDVFFMTHPIAHIDFHGQDNH